MKVRLSLVVAVVATGLFTSLPAEASLSCYQVDGLSIFGYDGSEYRYIGSIANEFNSDSIANEFGSYGNEFSSKSMFNDFSTWGNEFSSYSPFNDFSSRPPVLINDDLDVVGFVTTNSFKLNSINPYVALACAKDSFRSPISNHEDITFDSIDDLDYPFSYTPPTFFLPTPTPQTTCPLNSTLSGDSCICNTNLYWNDSLNICTNIDSVCKSKYGSGSFGSGNLCYCTSGYQWNTDSTQCILSPQPVQIPPTDSGLEQTPSNNHIVEIIKPDPRIVGRTRGRLLLQVEDGGRIWYVQPISGERFEVTFSNALPLFQTFAVGISNVNLDKIAVSHETRNGDRTLASRFKGQFLLQVEDGGRIWYVFPDTLKRYEVTWENLMSLFRSLAMGITNVDLYKIQEGLLD